VHDKVGSLRAMTGREESLGSRLSG